MKTNDKNHKVCLNCGSEFVDDSNYCHVCGQSVSTERLSTGNFFVSIVSRLSRINKGVIFTCYNLLIHPWDVISDYIKGKRVKYTAPVQLLIILSFITVVFSALGFISDPEEYVKPYFNILCCSYLQYRC